MAEVRWTDADGGPGDVLLFVKDGYLNILEIIKYGDAPIMKPPTPDTIEPL